MFTQVTNKKTLSISRQFLNVARRSYATIMYTKDHEWVRFESGSLATIGISDHYQKKLGDMVLVELSVNVSHFD